MFNLFAYFVITVPYIATAGLAFAVLGSAILALPTVPILFFTPPVGTLLIFIIYSSAAISILYFSVLLYFVQANWSKYSSFIYNVYSEVFEQTGYAWNHVSVVLQCALDSQCRQTYLKNQRREILIMGFYLGIVMQIVFSLQFDVMMAYSSWQPASKELEYSTMAKKLKVHWFLIFITAAMMVPNIGVLIFGGFKAVKAVLDKVVFFNNNGYVFDLNEITQAGELIIGAAVALIF